VADPACALFSRPTVYLILNAGRVGSVFDSVDMLSVDKI